MRKNKILATLLACSLAISSISPTDMSQTFAKVTSESAVDVVSDGAVVATGSAISNKNFTLTDKKKQICLKLSDTDVSKKDVQISFVNDKEMKNLKATFPDNVEPHVSFKLISKKKLSANAGLSVKKTDLKDDVLYHLTDGGWQKVSFQVKKGAVEFSINGDGFFIFAKGKQKISSVQEKEKSDEKPLSATRFLGVMMKNVQLASEENPDEVVPVEINKFNIRYVSGAKKENDGSLSWTPTENSDRGTFIFRADYTMSGIFSSKKGAFRLELPLHLFKSKDGGWADTFDCSYPLASDVTDGDNPSYVYSIDKEKNLVIITNYDEHITGEAGYVEFSYTTNRDVSSLVPIGEQNCDIYASNASKTTTANAKLQGIDVITSAKVTSVYIDTPTSYDSWNTAWGEKPSDADSYKYLIWGISSKFAYTGVYDYKLASVTDDLGGNVVGYRMNGASKFTDKCEVKDTDGVWHTDYVLTRYKKSDADKMVEEKGRCDVSNKTTVTCTKNQKETSLSSSRNWAYIPPKYTPPYGKFWAEKYGETTDYSLDEFLNGDENSITDLRYRAYGEAYTYPYTLADGATGTEQDAANGKYGQKKVDFTLTDDTFYLNKDDKALDSENYDINRVSWGITLKDATFDKNTLSFNSSYPNFKEDDLVTIFVKDGEGNWHKGCEYHLKGGSYSNVDNTFIKEVSDSVISFKDGVKGMRFQASYPAYYGYISIYPSITLKRTSSVIKSVGDTGNVPLRNIATFTVSQNDRNIFSRTISGADTIRIVEKNSELKQYITGTNNNKKKRIYSIKWNNIMKETYKDNNGEHYIRQESGTFYSLLPAGGEFNSSSLSLYANGKEISDSLYDYSLIRNYKNSGRTLLKVSIKESTDTYYAMEYQTDHSYEAIRDFGKNILSSLAYETGNNKITYGSTDDGGFISDREILKGLDKNCTGKRFLYDESRYTINILMSASTGLSKKVKSARESVYAYNKTIYTNDGYDYSIRLANDANTESKNIIFFDSLENFYQESGEKKTLESDWKGTLQSVDLSNLSLKGVDAVIYLSKEKDLNPWEHHDLKEKKNGESIWIPYNDFVKKYGVEKAAAIAVDASKNKNGNDFVLGKNESMSFSLNMKAPKKDTTGELDPQAYGNIFVSRSAAIRQEDTTEELEQFFHQDYTRVHLRVVADKIAFTKVNTEDETEKVEKAVYQFKGISQYGTVYNEEKVTDKNGEFSLSAIEPGTYDLMETGCTDDWLLDRTVYKIIVDGEGNVSINGLEEKNGAWVLKDAPRIHANIIFRKSDSVTNLSLQSVKFRLSGTSDYGTDVMEYAVSEKNGVVSFKNTELGVYELTEVETIDGYIKNDTKWKAEVTKDGVALLYEGETEVKVSGDGYYQITNEPYHTVRFVKSSSYGDNIFLEGAEFELKGISDYGNEYDKTSTSGSADDGGLVEFTGLEPGEYQLRETKAPEKHDLSSQVYDVKVNRDGSFTIDGLNKIAFGGNEKNKVYNFMDTKTEGTIVLTKVWKDLKTNEERVVPDMTIAGNKPSKNPLGYTVTFDAGTSTFQDGSTKNEVVYNSSGKIVSGTYKVPDDTKGWCTDKEFKNRLDINGDGSINGGLSDDITVYAKYPTYVLKKGSEFKSLIPQSATSVVFTDEVIPSDATVIDVDEDGDGGVVGWLDGTVFKVSTQKSGKKVMANADASYMFYECSGLTTLDLSGLDTSKVTTMYKMFYYCSRLTTLDVTGFDTSKVTNMFQMFSGCSKLTTLDLSGFDTSKVTDMHDMFCNCSGLTTLDLSGFDTSNVTYMYSMFYGCSKLTTLDLSGFDTSKVTKMYEMFNGCSNLTTLDVTGWNTSKVTNMGEMFYDCSKLTTLDLSGFDTSNVTDMRSMFRDCSNLTTLDLSGFDTSKVTDMSYMFKGCSNLTTLDVTRWDTSNVTDMSYMFYGCSNLTTLDVTRWDTSNVTDMSYMFKGCSNLTTLDVTRWDTSNVTDMSSMFYGCSKLTTLDLSGFDTSNVTNMSYMFCNCSSLTTSDLSGFDTSNVTNMSYMFSGCSSLTTLNVTGFDTSNVTSMGEMFSVCSNLTTLDVTGFDTSNVTDMNYMFSGCSSLTTLNVTGFDTSNVTNMCAMFYDCSNLTTLDVTGFDTSKVTSMSKMFYGCSNLTTLDLSGLDTSKVTNMNSMFYNCSKLTTLDLSGFDTSKVTDMSGMFSHCSGLTTLDLSGFDTSKVTNMRRMFWDCSKLTTIYIGDKWKTASNNGDMFYRCGTSTLTHK